MATGRRDRDGITTPEKSEGDPVCADKIEITREMVEAGADELMGFALPDGGRLEWEKAAAAAYRTMVLLARAKCKYS